MTIRKAFEDGAGKGQATGHRTGHGSGHCPAEDGASPTLSAPGGNGLYRAATVATSALLGGAAAGALTGAMAGPLGTAIGAALGAVAAGAAGHAIAATVDARAERARLRMLDAQPSYWPASEQAQGLAWEQARPATRDAWERLDSRHRS